MAESECNKVVSEVMAVMLVLKAFSVHHHASSPAGFLHASHILESGRKGSAKTRCLVGLGIVSLL
jgi:hypothetical protein